MGQEEHDILKVKKAHKLLLGNMPRFCSRNLQSQHYAEGGPEISNYA